MYYKSEDHERSIQESIANSFGVRGECPFEFDFIYKVDDKWMPGSNIGTLEKIENYKKWTSDIDSIIWNKMWHKSLECYNDSIE
jgi:hypothetical protein